MQRIIAFILSLFLGSIALSAVDPGYENAKGYAASCPDLGQVGDTWSFYTCNCTSYAAYRVSQDWARIYGSQHKFSNQYFFAGLSSAEKGSIASRMEGGMNYLNPGTPYSWSNAGRWGRIAKVLGALRTKPYLGMVAWWDTDTIGGVGHVAFVVDKGINPKTGLPGAKFKEYNFSNHLSFDEHWINLDNDDAGLRPNGYIDLTDLEYRHLIINKQNHPSYFTYDAICKESMPSNRVERFRMPDGGLLRTLIKQSLADTPDDRIWYYGPRCDPQLSASLKQLQTENMGQIVDGHGGKSLNSSLDLNLDFDIMHPQGYELYAGRDVLGPPLAVDLRVRVKAEGADVAPWMKSGKDTIELDYYVRLGSEGSWQKIHRGYLTASKLTEGVTLQETYRYILPNLPLDQISFQVVVDPEEEAEEVNEENNKSRVEVFDFNQHIFTSCDLTVSSIMLDDGKITLYEGESYGLKGAIRNIGTTLCPYGIRSTYYEKKPGQSVFTIMADDGSDQWELIPGRDQWEHTMNQPFTASVPGTHAIMFCANTNHANPEVDDTNNCTQSTFEVRDLKPDLVVTDLFLTVGSSIIRNGGTVKRNSFVHPQCTVKNQGNGNVPRDSYQYYFINADRYRGRDMTARSEVCTGCSVTHGMSSDSIRLGDTGNRTYRCCADATGVISESNESNNCATMNFTVR